MSLINQMLKDVEARRQQGGNAAPQTASVTPCHSPQRQRTISLAGILPLLLVLGVAVGAAGWWWQQQKAPQQVAVVSSPAEPPSSSERPSVPSAAVAYSVAVVAPEAKKVVEVVSLPAAQKLAAQEPVQNRTTVVSAPSVAAADTIELAPGKVVVVAPVAIEAIAIAPVASAPAPVVVKLPPSTLIQAQQLRDQAQRLVTQRRYAAAAFLYEQALQLDDSSPKLWHQLAVIYLRAQQLDEALRIANSGCQLYHNNPPLRVVQARLLVELGQKEQALAALGGITLPPVKTSGDYYALLATLQQQSGDLVGAEKNYALLTAAFPQRGDWWFGRAICADRLGQRKQATLYFKQALGWAQLKPKLKRYALQQLTRLQG